MTLLPELIALIILIENLNKRFGDFHVLKDIHLAVRKRERLVICGPSGSGKSTLIRPIKRLEKHQKGRIVVDGIELTDDAKRIDQVRRKVAVSELQPVSPQDGPGESDAISGLDQENAL